MGRKTYSFLLASIIAAAAGANADIVYSIDGSKLTVTASSAYENRGLKLLWDSTDKGSSAINWSNSATITHSVPSVGGTYTIDLATLGISAGTPCRVASYMNFSRLNALKQSGYKCYFNSGIFDYNVYGIRFGYYSVAKNENSGPCIGSRGAGFVVYANDSDRTKISVNWRGTKLSQNPSVKYGQQPSDAFDSAKINEFAFTNGVFTLNGATVNSSLGTGVAVGNANLGIRIGTSQADAGKKAMFGWWTHVSFDGADGSMIRDYVPARRVADNVVGFYDKVSRTFTSSESSDAFVAGTATGETLEGDFAMETATFARLGFSVDKSVLTITVPACCAGERLSVLWDDSDKGDDEAAWAHSAVVADVALAGTYTVYMSSLGMRNGQFCRVAASDRYYPLDMLLQDSKSSYINTGIKDSDVYGVRFGYYSVAKSDDGASCIGSYGSLGGFVLYANGFSRINVSVVWRGAALSDHPEVRWGSQGEDPDLSKLNEFAFTNGVFTVNGATVNSSLGAGAAAGKQGKILTVGASTSDSGAGKGMFGWWSHVSFDDADGNRILDYIPVKRATDDAVGFWDRASRRFLTSSGTGGFTAGPASDAPQVVFEKVAQTFVVSTIPGMVVTVR